VPGCGFWADFGGAASSTGEGERIARVMLCRLALEAPDAGAFSVEGALTVVDQRVGGSAGLVAVLADGRWNARCNTEIMGVAWRAAGMSEARVELVAGPAHG
jgi:isoaspartyl peptidase/L-asparaginase-like protein (Ntn-hydrolase superfamily)